MAQKPVPNALILELEPVVQQELRRHIDTEDLWYAHDYVPFDQGENFAFLGGRDWDPSQVTLPKHVTDALEILLITKDNLAGYHREFVVQLHPRGEVGPLDRPLDRRGAPARHRAAQLPGGHPRDRPGRQRGRARRARDEGLPRRHLHARSRRLVFMAFFERAHAVFCRNLEAQITEPVLKGLIGRIAKRRGTPRGVLRQPRRALPDLQPRRDDRGDRAPRRRTRRRRCRHRRVPDKVAQRRRGRHLRPEQLRQVISDRITAWGLADEPALRAVTL